MNGNTFTSEKTQMCNSVYYRNLKKWLMCYFMALQVIEGNILGTGDYFDALQIAYLFLDVLLRWKF